MLINPDPIPGGDVDRWLATLVLDDAPLARRALQGDAVARAVARLPHPRRWFELVGGWFDRDAREIELASPLPLAMEAAHARWQRRRAILRGGR
jgi:hypothetical protein